MSSTHPWQELGDRVYTRRYAFYDQQIGLVLGDGAALVIDTRTMPSHAREIVGDARLITPWPISIVVNTHAHGDHCFGNSVFAGAQLWGQRGAVRFLAETGVQTVKELTAELPDLAADLAQVEFVPPTHLVDARGIVEVGGRAVQLAFHGRGHTNHDLVVTIPDVGVTFAGDLVEEGAAPYFGDGYPLDWPGTLDAVLASLAHGPVVPGHGAVGDRAFVERSRHELQAVVAAAQRVRAGEPIDEVTRDVPYAPEPAREAVERALAQIEGRLDR